ncbi:MAG TPA: type I-E CRISPR-associated protein Cas5/CasD [Anaerolineaceae bacterium]|nr:type I-E CRISPR-associated protein Cas5/CasD [Anaerolineaceae bacterium]
MANTLFLRLEGPLQAWGERARWSVRDTSTEPTKSGVVGMLGCALGISADQDLADLSRGLRMGVRCEREGDFLTDFHTVIGGVISAEGKVKKDTVLSRRTYLCDASYLVALQGKTELIERLSKAVQKPVWPVYLGRRSCVPAKVLYEGEGDFDGLLDALQRWPYQGKLVDEDDRLRVVVDVDAGQGTQRRDEILSNSHRVFLPRYTREHRIRPVTLQEVD